MAKKCVDDDSKERIGQEAEDEFARLWECSCGHGFIHQRHPLPDYKCPSCGQEVDVKASPEAEDYGAITISKIPFEKYPPSMIIAWRPAAGDWRGLVRMDAIVIEEPRPPDTMNRKRPTWYYRIAISNFVRLNKLLECQVKL